MQHYRRDIDGLRSVAVLLVVLFHFDIAEGLRAGFIGVDIFFVISGFLIVPKIQEQLFANTFTFGAFFSRRIRRLAPAFLTTILMTYCVGLAVLTPRELSTFSREALYSQFYVSNIYYWRFLDYFGIQSDGSFLLHTWSLAVEEQFYLTFPFFLWIAARLIPKRLTTILFVVLVVSFVLNVSLVNIKPQLTFYLLPTRAWEFAVGALIPFFRDRVIRERLSIGWLASIGLVILIFAFAIYSPGLAFPGWYAVLPVTATTCLLLAGDELGGWWTKCASHNIPVYIGRISYELYLVHWPVRIFLPILVLDYGLPVRVTAVMFCIVLAAIVHHIFDKPVRRRLVLAKDELLIAAYVTSTVVVSVALAFTMSDGLPRRFSLPALAMAQASDDANLKFRSCENQVATPCVIGAKGAKPTWLIYGDSHADALAPAFAEYLSSRGAAAYFVFRSGCLPISNGNCGEFDDAVERFADSHPEIGTTVLVSTWRQPLERGYTDDNGNSVTGFDAINSFNAAFNRTVAARSAGGRRVIIWLPVPGALRPVPGALARNIELGRNWDVRLTLEEYDKKFSFLFRAISRHPTLIVIRPARYICPKIYCDVVRDGRPIYHDDAHPAASQMPLYYDIIRAELGATERNYK